MNFGFQGLSFDLWNTLIVSNPAFKEAQIKLFSDFLEVSEERLSPALLYLDKELDKKAERTGLQTNFEERIRLLAQKLVCNLPETPLAYLYEAQEALFLTHLPYPTEAEVGKLLELLVGKGLRLFLVSNTGFLAGKTLRLVLEKLEMDKVWDLMLFSDEIGYSKPDKRIFEPVLDYFSASLLVHIGDNFITDYQGARKMGIHSLIYTKNLRNFDANLDTIHSLWDLLKFTA